MKVSDIIRRVKRQFGDEINAQINDEDIVGWINDACLDIVTDNNTNQAPLTGTAPVVAGQKAYELPEDLLTIRSVRVNGFILKSTTNEQAIEDYTSMIDSSSVNDGPPMHFWTFAGKLIIYPVPSQSVGTVDIIYTKLPAQVTTADLSAVPDVPVQYHTSIVEYCIGQAAELDDNLDHYQLKMGQFASKLAKLKGTDDDPHIDDYYPSITYVSEY